MVWRLSSMADGASAKHINDYMGFGLFLSIDPTPDPTPPFVSPRQPSLAVVCHGRLQPANGEDAKRGDLRWREQPAELPGVLHSCPLRELRCDDAVLQTALWWENGTLPGCTWKSEFEKSVLAPLALRGNRQSVVDLMSTKTLFVYVSPLTCRPDRRTHFVHTADISNLDGLTADATGRRSP